MVDSRRRLALIHNGIIENFLPLKKRLIAEGWTFTSDTDTEVVANLISSYLDGDLRAAVARAVKELEGMYAFAVVTVETDGQEIVAARQGPPLVIGLAEGEQFLASDPAALLAYTKDVVFLENGDLGRLTPAGVEIQDRAGKPVERPVQRLNWDPIQAEKGGYKHFMLKEIHEQPQAVQDTFAGRVDFEQAEILFDTVQDLQGGGEQRRAPPPARLRHLLARGADRQVPDRGASPACRSRSTTAPSTATATRSSPTGCWRWASRSRARRRTPSRPWRRPASAARACSPICNVARQPGDPDQRGGDLHPRRPGDRRRLDQGVHHPARGPLPARPLPAPGASVGKLERHYLDDLTRLPQAVDEVIRLGRSSTWTSWPASTTGPQNFLYLGRGINYPIALEGALKLKEISYIHAEGYPAGEMKHGPIALIDENLPVVAIATGDRSSEKTKSNMQEVKARDGIVIALTDRDPEELGGVADEVIEVPSVSPLLQPIVNVVPLQLLAYFIGVRRGADVDQPRNLAKSVTVE